MMQNQYTKEQLETIIKDAWTYENRAGWGVEDLETEYIGTLRRGKKYLLDLYVDTSGRYWFKTRVITENGVISSHEAVFGYPDKQLGGQKRKQRRRFR